MSDTLTEAGNSYSRLVSMFLSGLRALPGFSFEGTHGVVGVIYIFNLIVGTGALTMPRAFQTAGWLLSLILVIGLAFVSYLTTTLVVEAMGAANAVLKDKGPKRNTGLTSSEVVQSDENPNRPLLQENSSGIPSYGIRESSEELETMRLNNAAYQLSNITERVEMGQMAALFYPRKFMLVIFYIIMCCYLYGDLAIYAAAVPKSLRDVACTYSNSSLNESAQCGSDLKDTDRCWPNTTISRLDAYRIFLAAFILILGPFIFFDVQKTKYLQLFTTVMRWLAFLTMIVLTLIRLGRKQGEGHPTVANFSGIPTLFGVCVYSFMCHHSLPSLVTPVREKSKLSYIIGADYALILGFYTLLSLTGVFSFHDLNDLYTLNFLCDSSEHPITTVKFLQYFLALFPVFTLSTNFPIIGVTLRNNLRTLGHLFRNSFPVERVIFTFLAIIPPVLIAFITDNVEVLVSVTGSYAGAGIQYAIPVALVFFGRRTFTANFGTEAENRHKSPFSHWIWLVIVIMWLIMSISLVTVNNILKFTKHDE